MWELSVELGESRRFAGDVCPRVTGVFRLVSRDGHASETLSIPRNHIDVVAGSGSGSDGRSVGRSVSDSDSASGAHRGSMHEPKEQRSADWQAPRHAILSYQGERGSPCPRSQACVWSQGEQLLVVGGAARYSLDDQFRMDCASVFPEYEAYCHS